jgi:ubiquinone/menaquinone biosynthesis C-methylase UbiE
MQAQGFEESASGLCDRMDARTLYTKRVDAYVNFNSLFRAAHAYRAFFRTYDRLHPGMRILNAGCGTGMDALALISALRRRGLGYQTLDAFDLTPAMLERFRRSIEDTRVPNVRLREANILNLHSLPLDWTGYDLIVSAAMLEYVPRDALTRALSGLRERLSRRNLPALHHPPKLYYLRPDREALEGQRLSC